MKNISEDYPQNGEAVVSDETNFWEFNKLDDAEILRLKKLNDQLLSEFQQEYTQK